MPCNECCRLPTEQNIENMEKKEGNIFQSRKESNKQDKAKEKELITSLQAKQTHKTIRQSQCTASSGILPLDIHK